MSRLRLRLVPMVPTPTMLLPDVTRDAGSPNSILAGELSVPQATSSSSRRAEYLNGADVRDYRKPRREPRGQNVHHGLLAHRRRDQRLLDVAASHRSGLRVRRRGAHAFRISPPRWATCRPRSPTPPPCFNVTELRYQQYRRHDPRAACVYRSGHRSFRLPPIPPLDGSGTSVWIFPDRAEPHRQRRDERHAHRRSACAQHILAGRGRIGDIGTTAHVEGVILSATSITLRTGASVNGRLLAQTAVDIDSGTP